MNEQLTQDELDLLTQKENIAMCAVVTYTDCFLGSLWIVEVYGWLN